MDGSTNAQTDGKSVVTQSPFSMAYDDEVGERSARFDPYKRAERAERRVALSALGSALVRSTLERFSTVVRGTLGGLR